MQGEAERVCQSVCVRPRGNEREQKQSSSTLLSGSTAHQGAPGALEAEHNPKVEGRPVRLRRPAVGAGAAAVERPERLEDRGPLRLARGGVEGAAFGDLGARRLRARTRVPQAGGGG